MEEEVVPEGYVCLVSAEQYEFLIEIEYAKVSKTIKRTLESGFGESVKRKIEFPTIGKDCLELACRFFYHRMAIKDNKSPKPKFDIPLELCVELMMASEFLDV